MRVLDAVADAQEEEQREDKNQFKVRALGLAVKIIEQVPFPIRSSKEVSDIEGIGPGITRRISEFLQEKTAKRDQRALECHARAELRQVQGIGRVRAAALVKAGCMSIADLRQPQFFETLRPVERFGVQHFTHMRMGVQRHEAEAVLRAIQEVLPPPFEAVLAGSYRRGAPVSSEIDVLLLHPLHAQVPVPAPDAHWREPRSTITGRRRVPFNVGESGADNSALQREVIPALRRRGLLGDHFTDGHRKWQGMVKLPGSGDLRRLDLSFAPVKSKGAALIALTGDFEFNMHLRLKADKMGLHLNEYGLWQWMQSAKPPSAGAATDADSVQDTSSSPSDAASDSTSSSGFWRLIRAETEEAIMRELGMDFVEPTRRNFAYVERSSAWAKGRGRKKEGA
ncbi:hypothetical protein HDZ31DRAFT_45470 [Schizophyllum fasciatum]